MIDLCKVKQIVEAHGGTIECLSERKVGSTFTFSVRVWDEKDPQKNVLQEDEYINVPRQMPPPAAEPARVAEVSLLFICVQIYVVSFLFDVMCLEPAFFTGIRSRATFVEFYRCEPF